MSGVQATLALVLLRNLRRGGKDLRKWFARHVLHIVVQHQVETERARRTRLYHSRYSSHYYYWERSDMMHEAFNNTETAPRHIYTPIGSRPLSRVAYFSHYHGCSLIKWRRVGHPEPDSLYYLLPAPQRKRRSARLSMKRNKRKKLKCAK